MQSALPYDSVPTISPTWRRIIRNGWGVLVLNSIWTIALTLYYTRQFADHLPARLAVGLARLGLTPDFYFWFGAFVVVVLYLSYLMVTLLIFWRRSNERMALFAAVFLLAFGTASAYVPAPEFLGSMLNSPVYSVVPLLVNNFLAWPLLVAFFALFPDGRFVPGWMRYIAIYGALFALSWGISQEAFTSPQGLLAIFVLGSVVLIFGGILYAQVWRYRHHSTPVQRQQTKWLLYALAIVVPVTIAQQVLISAIVPSDAESPVTSTALELTLGNLGTLIFVLIPISIGIAILRYRLWDIDILIRRTLVYGAVTAALVLIYFGSVVFLQRIFSALTNATQNEIVTVLSTLAIAALFVPLRNHIQALIDKRFYRKKYDAQKVLLEFAEMVRDETDLENLTARLLKVVNETMQPKSVSVWLKREGERMKEEG